MLRLIKKNYFLLISVFLIFYFVFNLVSGERGLFSYIDKKVILSDLKNEELRKQSVNTVKGSYFGWLVQAFGGKTSQDNNLGTNIKVTGQSGDKEDKTTETQGQVNESTTTTYSVNADNCKYFNFKTGDFYSRGKKAFKEYINAKINEQFDKTNTPGNTIGFIPIEFNLKLEGISGFKIYNALVINQFFLPPQYPKALTFLIQGLSQKIDDKGWTTDLKTLSVPRSKPDSSIQIADQLSTDDLVELERRQKMLINPNLKDWV